MNPDLITKVRSLVREPVGILGFGIEGKSTCGFLLKCGFSAITIFDSHEPEELPNGIHYAGAGDCLSRLPEIKTLFRSPGIRADSNAVIAFKQSGGLLCSQTELFFELVPPEDIIGVTGTLGKGTCCSMLHGMFNKAGGRAVLGGNIGTPVLDLLETMESDTSFILELSSFQLGTLRRSPGTAVILRTTSEHMDWHQSQKEYWDHKANLVRFQGKKDHTVFCEDAPGSAWIAGQTSGQTLGYGGNSEIKVTNEMWKWMDMTLSAGELLLSGGFNLENLAAAAAAARRAGITSEDILAAAKSFKGLEHRLEHAGGKAGLDFYNDSYATRPEATIGALEAFSGRPLGIILGGSEKHADFSGLISKITSAGNIRGLALLGETSGRIQKEFEEAGLSDSIRIRICRNLTECLVFLISEVHKGIILLSPACASFGLFANYKERGEKFKELVSVIIRKRM
ncbi:UDP-N-acetylmuramoyl-L-alanine--D-glutamate ligase [Fibrobacterota bacterium]